MKLSNLRVVLLSCFFASGLFCAAEASETTELLDILRDKGTLSEEEYQGLTQDESTEISDNRDYGSDINIITEGGLEIATYTGRFSFKLAGRLMMDAAFYDDGKTDLGDGTELRRARIDLSGTVMNDWEYEFEVDFAEGDADIKDAYVAFWKFWPTAIKVGQFKEAFGLENMMSSNNISFMERAMIDELVPGRSIGIGTDMCGEKWTASAGFFGQEFDDDPDDEGDEGWAAAGRATFAPVTTEKKVLHFGGAVNYRKVDDEGEIKFNPDPESHVTDLEFADTDDIEDVDNVVTYGLECAGVYGSLSLQGEYVKSRVNCEHGLQDYEFEGFYTYAGWFVTGESRNYKSKSGKFGKLKPHNKFGALEVALRYSAIDLTDHDVAGGKQKNTTLGVNWYINSHVRVMINYIWVDNDKNADADGDALGNDDPRIFQSRFQLVF